LPVVPQSPYAVGTQVTSLVRSLCNDSQGQLFTDSYLLNYVNSAYRQVQLALANIGKQTFTKDMYIVTIPAIATVDPGLQVALRFDGISGNIPNPSNSPTLPQDLLEPLQLWERPTGSTDDFVPMINLTSHGGLPSVPQSFNLRWWAWNTDFMSFIGAEEETDIRIRYQCGFIPFTLDNNNLISGTLNILLGIDAVAYLAAYMVLNPRGSPLAAGYAAIAQNFINQLVNQESRAQQHAGPFRRRAFSSRYGVGRGWY
jgi:hypothetical protein